MKRKYVCTKNENDVEEIFTFPKEINHDEFAEVLSHIRTLKGMGWTRMFREPISAGFVDNNGNCYGRSETLDLDSRPEEDTKLLGMQNG